MDLLNRVIRKSLIIVLPAAAASAIIEWKTLPLGIILGAVLGIANLRGLVQSVEWFLGSRKATAKVIFFSMTRLVMVFAVIFISLWLKIVNIFGMLFGFTVVFVLILYEGMMEGRKK